MLANILVIKTYLIGDRFETTWRVGEWRKPGVGTGTHNSINHSYHTVNHSNNTIKCAKGRLAPSNTLRVGLEPIAEIISGVWCGNGVEILSIIQLKCYPFKHNPK